ncbi:MAG: glycosyltransferase family 4 protein [Acidobacteriota bacterium]|nr:MAG: glycosyltransferase family 4 protein [Acidobacteriota bacterium]
MRILYLSQYFPPEMGAPSARVCELSRHWANAGHDVTVLTAFPHHPTGVKPPHYRWRLWARERHYGVRVIRTYVLATPNRGLRRAVSYASFFLSSMLLGMWLAPRPDVLVATSPQLLVALAGYGLSRLKRCPFVFEVRDLWPRVIVEVGAMRRGWFIRWLERVELALYHRAVRVVVVTEGLKRNLVGRGIPADKVGVIPNGVDSRSPCPASSIRSELGLDGKFLVAYVGTHGMSHGLEVVLDAAEKLRERSDVQFVMVGEGARKDALKEQARARGLANVHFLPEQPRERAQAILAASDAVVVPLRKLPLFEITVPSKLFEGMAAARPVLLGVQGEARRLVEEAACGYAFEPENGAALADSIHLLLQAPDEGRRLGEAGRAYVLKHYSRQKQAERYAALLEAAA